MPRQSRCCRDFVTSSLGEVPEGERFNPSGLVARLKETGMRAVFGETVG